MTISEAKLPEGRIRRHILLDRAYHWLMAICVLTLMGTAFLPIVGIKFEWLTLHWTTGIVLTVLVVIHIVRALIWQDFWAMWFDGKDVRNAIRVCTRVFGSGAEPGLPGKYNGLQKLYHLAIAVLVLAIVVSGLTMLLKIDTPWWRRNPYVLADYQWGEIYAVHGLAAMALITLIMIHIYYAVRPDEWYLSRSMFRGWITRAEYDRHFDKERWAGDKS